MSSTALKVMMMVMVITALVFGFFAYRLSQGLATPPPEPEPEPILLSDDQTLAVVAVEPIKAFEPLPQSSVALVAMTVLPEQYYASVEEVVGKVPLSDIGVGAPLTVSYFRESNSLVRQIPQGHQAVSVEIDDIVAVGGFIQPGDIVDVLLYVRGGGREVEDSQARILIMNVRVLAYEERVINVPATEDSEAAQQQKTKRVRTAVLAVPDKEVTRVMLAASYGKLRLSLRGEEPIPADTESEANGDLVASATAKKPLTPEQQKEAERLQRIKEEQPITLKELTDLGKKKEEKKKAPAKKKSAARKPSTPPVYIYRGSEIEKVK